MYHRLMLMDLDFVGCGNTGISVMVDGYVLVAFAALVDEDALLVSGCIGGYGRRHLAVWASQKDLT